MIGDLLGYLAKEIVTAPVKVVTGAVNGLEQVFDDIC